jgi:hypothetical protein
MAAKEYLSLVGIPGQNSGRQFRLESGRCFWCSQHHERLTWDHIPGKSLFPARVHKQLPQVPACRSCNAKWQTDSEYFRDYLVRGELASCQHPDLDHIRDACRRAENHRTKRGFHPSVFRLRNSWSQTASGLHVQGQAEAVNMARIARMIGATAYVLHLYATGQPIIQLPTGAQPGYRSSVVDIQKGSQHYEAAKEALKTGRQMAQGLLSFAWFFSVDDENEKEWLVCFYDHAIFQLKISPVGIEKPESLLFDGLRVSPQKGPTWRPL